MSYIFNNLRNRLYLKAKNRQRTAFTFKINNTTKLEQSIVSANGCYK